MKVLFKWLGISLIGVLVLGLLTLAAIYGLSNRIINKTYEQPPTTFTASYDSLTIVEGERLAKVHGCSAGCHGPEGKGQKWIDIPGRITVFTPNLPRIFASYSDAELDGSIRYGVKPNGKSTIIMPSYEYYYFTDHDLSALIGYFRSLPPEMAEGPVASFELGLNPRMDLILGDFSPQAEKIKAHGPQVATIDTADLLVFGEYLANTSCGGCHSPDFRGGQLNGRPTPSLKIVAAYTQESFNRFLTTGIAIGDRETRMTKKAKESFSFLTAHELKALYTFFSTFARETGTDELSDLSPQQSKSHSTKEQYAHAMAFSHSRFPILLIL